MKIVFKKASSLKVAGYNPRTISPEKLDALIKSIKQFGMVDPFIVNVHPKRMNIIIGGHQRLEAAKKLDVDKVPCVELSLPFAKEKELNIRLNKNTGDWNFKLLKENFDIESLLSWGFEKKELDIDFEKLVGKPSKAKKVRSNIEVQFHFGELRFVVSQNIYVAWMDALARKVGMKKEKQVDEVKRLLKVIK